MDYKDKYLKYKNKYLELKKNKQIGGSKLILYHGSPCSNIKILSQRIPRGDNKFNTQKGVYLTTNFLEAVLYSLARDIKRENKGWGLKFINNKIYLLLRKDKWFGNKPTYKLNKKGYVYTYEDKNNDAEQNPDKDRKTEFIIKKNVSPDKKIIVTIEDVPKNRIKYLDRNDWYEAFNINN